ncbi:MAG: hemolysin III family protein [Clostridia bacterium]|nr:hemolysin III family protein [Clostridia bacterium]
MKRTKLRDRKLPDYTRSEEIFNMVTHIVGGGLGIIALVLCILLAAIHKNLTGLLSGIVFGLSMIMLYTMSSIYHGLTTDTSKKVFQILDHCTIYFLISGTYTPLLLCALRHISPVACWITFGVVWGCTAVAVTLTAIDLEKYKVFSMICYLGMGWCILFSIRSMYRALSAPLFWLLLSGGIFYTIGALLFKIGAHRRYFHSIFHIFVLLGSLCHTLCVLGIM